MYRVIHKKVFRKSEEKMHKKMKMKDENSVYEQHQYGICFCKKNPIMIYVADMAILMSNFDNDQISSKFAQR